MHALAWFKPFLQGLFLGIVAMLLHELGHLVAAIAVGVKIKTIGLRWRGLYTVREAGPPAKNMLVSLAGPLVNLALIASWPWSHKFGLANLCFTFFNLLPMEGSDGDRVMRCWMETHRKKPRPPSQISGSVYGPFTKQEEWSGNHGPLANESVQTGD
jgi:Zn-dependent protease